MLHSLAVRISFTLSLPAVVAAQAAPGDLVGRLVEALAPEEG